MSEGFSPTLCVASVKNSPVEDSFRDQVLFRFIISQLDGGKYAQKIVSSDLGCFCDRTCRQLQPADACHTCQSHPTRPLSRQYFPEESQSTRRDRQGRERLHTKCSSCPRWKDVRSHHEQRDLFVSDRCYARRDRKNRGNGPCVQPRQSIFQCVDLNGLTTVFKRYSKGGLVF